MLRFKSLSARPKHFYNFVGLTVPEFLKLKNSIQADWQKAREAKYKTNRIRKIGGGRKLSLPDLDEVLIDATEQRIPRPKKKQTRKNIIPAKRKLLALKLKF